MIYNRDLTYFITSSPSVSMDGAINPQNGFLEELKSAVRKDSHCVFVTTYPDNVEFSEHCSLCMCKALEEAGFTFSHWDLLDRRTEKKVKDLLNYADFLILGGGHVPSQNSFLSQLGMARLLQSFKGVVMGISAGSMNMARTVYAQPEEKGEAVDPSYKRFLKGLGITDIQIIPHYYMTKDAVLDGYRIIEDIAMKDSIGRRFYLFPDGTYVLGKNGQEVIHGEFWVLENGVMRKVCENGEKIILPFI